VVATLAMELQLIGQTIFVAIVFSALLSSLLRGPLIGIQARVAIGIGKIENDPVSQDTS